MQQRQLGTDGPMIPVLGFGAWPIGGGMGKVDEQNAIDTVRAAIDNGITLLDTAEYYRTSEGIMGRALKDGYRERCFLATKASFDYSPKGIREAMDNSLRALGVDYVDLYQIHSWNSRYPIADSMGEMVRLQQEGKARYLGVSNFDADHMRQSLQTTFYHSNQIVYNLFEREIEAEDIPFCAEHGIGILAHSPLAKGLLTGRYRPGHQFAADDERSGNWRFRGDTFARYIAAADKLNEVARDKGITLVQLAIAWTLRLPAITCTLVGAKNPQQVAEHVAAADVTFSDDELARIETILNEAT